MAPTPNVASQVRVGVRIRPLTPKESSEGGRAVVDGNALNRTVSLSKRKFTYDFVFHSNATQSDLYTSVAPPLLRAFLNGYNATVLAYGQTGSGKTYTVGSESINISPRTVEDVHNGTTLCENDGLIPRFMTELFASLVAKRDASERDFQSHEAKHSVSLVDFRVSASFLEIYGDSIHDLLDEDRNALKIREDSKKEVVVVGLQEKNISNALEAMQVLNTGTMNRTTAATLMNCTSSRSHAVFTVHLQQASRGAEGDEITTTSRFTFVDLAGSERMKKTGAKGERAKEGIKINEGLLALGNVINALADDERLAKGEKIHVPYRQSKLTRLLQDALGGNSQTFFLACVSPSDTNASETLSTLHYANRARNIRNAPTRNVDATAEELRRLRSLTGLLRCELVKHRFSGVLNPIATDPVDEKAEIGCIDENLLHRDDVVAYMRKIEEKVPEMNEMLAYSSTSFTPIEPTPLFDSTPVTPLTMTETILNENVDLGKEEDDDLSEVDGNPEEDIQIIEELLDRQNNEQISNIQGDIEEQEERLLQIKEQIKGYHDMKVKYEMLVEQVGKLESEKSLLAGKLEKAQSESPANHCSNLSLSIKEKLENVKRSLTKARQDVRKQQQKCREAEQDAQRCKGLERRIDEMKKAKASMIKQQKDDAKRRQEFSKTKSREIQQLRRSEKNAQKKVAKLEAECHRYKANLANSKIRYEKLENKLKQTESDLKQARRKKRINGSRGARFGAELGGDELGQFSPASGKINSIKFVLDKLVQDRVILHQNREVYALKVIECENLVQSMAREVRTLNELKRECEGLGPEHFGEALAKIHHGEEIVQDYLIKIELVENHLEELRATHPSIEEGSKEDEIKGIVFSEHEPALKMISKFNNSILRSLLLKLLSSCFASEIGRQRMKHELDHKMLVLSTYENEVATKNEKICLLSKSLAHKSMEPHSSKEIEKEITTTDLASTNSFNSLESNSPPDEQAVALNNVQGLRNGSLADANALLSDLEKNRNRELSSSEDKYQKTIDKKHNPNVNIERKPKEQQVLEFKCVSNGLETPHTADEKEIVKIANSSQSLESEQFKAYHSELARVRSEMETSITQAVAQTKELLSESHTENIEKLRTALDASASLELKQFQAEAEKQQASEVERVTNNLQEFHEADVERLKAEIFAMNLQSEQLKACHTEELARVRSEMSQAIAKTTEQLTASHAKTIENLRAELDAEAKKKRVLEVERATTDLKKCHEANVERLKAEICAMGDSSQSLQPEPLEASHTAELDHGRPGMEMLMTQAVTQTTGRVTTSHANKNLNAGLGVSTSLDLQQEVKQPRVPYLRQMNNDPEDSHDVVVKPQLLTPSHQHKEEMAALHSKIGVSAFQILEEKRPVVQSQEVQTESIKDQLNSLPIELEKTKEALSLSEEKNAKAEKISFQENKTKRTKTLTNTKQLLATQQPQDMKETPPTTPHKETYFAVDTSVETVTTPLSARSAVLPNFSKFDDLKQRYRNKFRNSLKTGDDTKPATANSSPVADSRRETRYRDLSFRENGNLHK